MAISGSSTAEIDAPLERVWKLVEDVEAAPKWQEGLKDVRGIERDADGRARFRVEGGRERITVAYGPKYSIAVIYAPRGQDFICFEPMSAITNAFNLDHDGLYKELQSVAPGATWKESFWLSVG